MECGEIKKFEVTAECPYCSEETEVTQDDVSTRTTVCQHCDESFRIVLE